VLVVTNEEFQKLGTCEHCVVMVKNGVVQTFSRVANLDEAIA
jgi:hypothetical protein